MTLRVAEGFPKDVGRGIARIDPIDMAKIQAEIGDIVEISGKRKSAARLMPTYPDHRGKGIVQIDGITRKNILSGIDDKVRISKASHANAEKIILSYVRSPKWSHDRGDLALVERFLEGIPVVAHDRIRADLFGTLSCEFEVVDTVPKGIVVITAATRIVVCAEEIEERKEPKVTYEDIGGLGKEIHRVREMIELPIRYPELFERLGIEPPKGILLTGAPGTGKTLIARAVASETDAYFIHVNGPEIIHKFYGESEARLRDIFEEARKHAPSIIFLDEIDAIAPKRTEVVGEVEKRVVAQLLALLDGLERRGQVIVIGATNIPNALDPALRRPGRFDREIAINVPDKNGRLEILQVHTRGMPLTDDVDLERLAQITHGFVGADIEALCKEAGMISLRRVLPHIEFETNEISDHVLDQLHVSMSDFLNALKEVEPSSTREVLVDIPDVKWDDIGGLRDIKEELIQVVSWPLKYPDVFKSAGIEPPRGILLYGPPGTGKTLLAKAIASESEANFISIKGPELLSKWVGESEKGVREIFGKARQAAPCIIFFDEIDAIAPCRSHASDSAVADRVVSQILTEIDGIEDLSDVIVIGATNRIDMIDPALLRPGRLELHLELPGPDLKERQEIIAIHLRGKPLAEDVSLEHLASITEGFVGAEIKAFCRRAGVLAIRDFLRRHGSSRDVPGSTLKIQAKHFTEAIEWVRSNSSK
ncbi:MAG: CDC48 family AAA ATPase [Firmicutes bacterium]|nr:CDC48 family AAA ATPase [Bacillota bacterium]